MKNLAVTLIELDSDYNSGNIGTITIDNIEDENQLLELHQKAIEALEAHFDTEVKAINFPEGHAIISVRNNDPVTAHVITSDGIQYKVEFQQTWIY